MCGCSILLTSVLSQWYSTYGWMNIQDVISGWVEVWLKHQATGLATLATCHSPPFEKGAPVRFLLSCWCIHLCIYKASPLPAYLCSSKKRTENSAFVNKAKNSKSFQLSSEWGFCIAGAHSETWQNLAILFLLW